MLKARLRFEPGQGNSIELRQVPTNSPFIQIESALITTGL